jgi:probable phosphoglycerate mutase
MRLILVRHGESQLGSVYRYAGRTDTPLSPEGRRQVLELADRFGGFRVDAVFSSDLLRPADLFVLDLEGPRIIAP